MTTLRRVQVTYCFLNNIILLKNGIDKMRFYFHQNVALLVRYHGYIEHLLQIHTTLHLLYVECIVLGLVHRSESCKTVLHNDNNSILGGYSSKILYIPDYVHD